MVTVVMADTCISKFIGTTDAATTVVVCVLIFVFAALLGWFIPPMPKWLSRFSRHSNRPPFPRPIPKGMWRLPLHPTSDQVFAFVTEWIKRLSAQHYDGALQMLYPGPSAVWTSSLIEQLIANYGSLEPDRSGHLFRVTPLECARGQCVRDSLGLDDDVGTGDVHPSYPIAVYWFRRHPEREPACLGWIHLDYPLDGEWSDLSSEFWLYEHDGNVVVELERIEVM